MQRVSITYTDTTIKHEIDLLYLSFTQFQGHMMNSCYEIQERDHDLRAFESQKITPPYLVLSCQNFESIFTHHVCVYMSLWILITLHYMHTTLGNLKLYITLYIKMYILSQFYNFKNYGLLQTYHPQKQQPYFRNRLKG